mmetsp:Transcript_15536/g.44956  ORF Transcript_15536/g.44956 Transcript_15536/m.44956 type:complete len:217 (-) Transcript_15536:466-1116(-)
MSLILNKIAEIKYKRTRSKVDRQRAIRIDTDCGIHVFAKGDGRNIGPGVSEKLAIQREKDGTTSFAMAVVDATAHSVTDAVGTGVLPFHVPCSMKDSTIITVVAEGMGIPTGHLGGGTEPRRRKADGNALGIQGLTVVAFIVTIARSWSTDSMLSGNDMAGQREVATQRDSAAGNGSTKGGIGEAQKWRHLGTLGRNTTAVVMRMRATANISGTGG